MCTFERQKERFDRTERQRVVVFRSVNTDNIKKYVARLFYEQETIKLYIDRVVSSAGGRYVCPPDVFCDNVMYDRLYDELVMYGKAEPVIPDNTVLELLRTLSLIHI